MRLDWLGTERLTWRDLRIIVSHLPRTSALFRSRNGDERTEWDVVAHLLAGIYDLQAAANYQRAVASGKRGVKKPRPIPRPGVKDRVKRVGRGAIPLSKFADWWESKRQDKSKG